MRHLDRSLGNLLKIIDNSDLMIVVGGNYLCSHPGFYIHSIPIIYAKFTKRKKIILLCHSLGPFNDFLSRMTSKLIFRNIDLVVFREKASEEYLKNYLKVAIPNKIIACDMALFLQPLENKVEEAAFYRRIGITVRPWCFSDKNQFNCYTESIASVACYLIERENFTVFLIPFSTVNGSENDIDISKIIYQRIYNKHSQSVHLLDVKHISPESVLTMLSKLKLTIFIGTRFHSVIFASIIGVPSVIISYHHFKAHGMCNMLGLSEYIIDIEHVNPVKLTNYALRLLANNRDVRKRLQIKVEDLRSE